MSARESLIGAGLAVVLVVGIVDAAVGHDDSDSDQVASPVPTSTRTDIFSPTPSMSETPSMSPTPKPRKSHRGGGAATPIASPTDVATSTTPSKSAEPEPSVASTRSDAPSLPPGVLGTFSYDTTGSEQTNIPGTRREFPKTTKITNKLEGCGVASTWKPMPEHVQKQLLCPDGDAIKVKAYRTTISFFGVSSGENFKCSGDSYVYRPGVKAGQSWTFKCKSPDAVATQTSRAVGYETLTVGGKRVRTLHVHVETTLKGDSRGSSTQDYWIATNKPVLVKEQGEVDATQQRVHYTSTYSLALTSLSPKT